MNDIKFLHFRRPAITLGQQGMRIERAGSFGGVTVAYRDLGNNHFQFGIGRCRNDERYSRKLGREAALNNFEQTPGKVMQVEATLLSFFREKIAKHISTGAIRKNLRAQISMTGKARGSNE